MLERRGQQFALLSFLEEISKEMGIEKKIQHMKPVPLSEEPGMLKPEAVEISLTDLTTEELVRLIFQIECSEKLLSVKRTTIQRSGPPGSGLLKAGLQVHTYAPIAASPNGGTLQENTTRSRGQVGMTSKIREATM